MSKFDDIKIPESIDDITKKAMKRGHNYKKKRKYKKIMVASIASVFIGGGVIGAGIMNPSIASIASSIPVIRQIIDYFNANDESLYKSDKEEFEKLGVELNLTTKDKGIEYTLDSASIDDNYITVFHTVRSDRNIKNIDKVYEDAYIANPIVDAYIDGENITSAGLIEHEATYISDNELKGMCKVDVSNVNIENNTEIVFHINEIFGVQGNWEVCTKVDKSKSIEETYNYTINKDYTINQIYDYHGEKVDIKHNINIEKVIISPLANKIVINEKPTKTFDDWTPMMGNSFVLFDENNNSLDVVDKGGSGVNPKTGIDTNSEEFLKATKHTKSLTLVPISYDESIENYMIEPKSIDKLPIVLEPTKYGKLIIEDIKITDKQIRYTYYKDGVVPYCPHLWFFDEDGNELQFSSSPKESLDRYTGRYTTILNLENNNGLDASKIKKISTYTDSDMKLLYDQQMKIDLIKD